jgi:hypothetical protein
MTSIDEKKKFIAEVLDIIRNYSDAVEQDTYIKELARISDTPKSILYELFKKTKTAKADVGENEDAQVSKNYTTPEDIILGILYENAALKSEITEKIIFPEGISEILKKALDNPASYFQNLDLDRTEKYKALAFSFSENTSSEKDAEKELFGAIHSLNRYYYKTLSDRYKTAMNS